MISLFLSHVRSPKTRSRRSSSGAARLASWWLAIFLCIVGWFGLHAQSDPAGDPTASSGDFDGLSTTGASYDTYTGNIKRTITDVQVPGSAGAIPLQFTRIYNSRYSAVPSAVAGGFGDAGWQHNYQWSGQIVTVSGVTTYQVGYPDGRVINFQMNRLHQAPDTLARGPAPTADRFAINPNGNNLHYLHLADGSQVLFSVQPDSQGNIDILRAEALIDPYQAVTTLFYASYQPTVSQAPAVTVLDHVTDPSGRQLFLEYGTQYFTGDAKYGTDYWVVINDVYWNDSKGTRQQDATYGYYVYGGSRKNELQQTTVYCALNHVVYSLTDEQHPQNQITATYTYYAAGSTSYPSTGGAPPLLVNADDPFFAGPMHQIHYQYTPATNYGVWGIAYREQNYLTQNNSSAYFVTSLTQDQPNTPNTATESRGDYTNATDYANASSNNHVGRTFNYGEGTVNSIQTNARQFQVTTATDFQGKPTYTIYRPRDDANGWGNVAQTIDATGYTTGYTTEALVGKITQVTLPDGRIHKVTWAGVDPSTKNQQLTANYPYLVTSTTDERSQVTYYDRIPNTGYVWRVRYPDGANEQFTYTPPFSGPNGYYYKIATYQNKLGATFTFNYGQNDSGYGPADLLKSVTRTYTDPATKGSHTETLSYTYYPNDRVKTVQDQRGIAEQFSYDARGKILQVTHLSDPSQSFVSYGYDNNGNCISVTDEDTHATTINYDDYRRIISIQVPVNAPSASGQVVNIIHRFAYDRRDSSFNVIGSSASHTASNWSASWLPSGAGSVRAFSPNNWLLDEYDGMHITAKPSGETLATDTDTTHRGITRDSQQNPLYNAIGQPLSTTDAQNFATTYGYDTLNRLQSVTDPLGGTNHTLTRSFYGNKETASGNSGVDCSGMLKSVMGPGTDLQYYPTVTSSYANYDVLGNLLQALVPSDIGPPTTTLASALDAVGDLIGQNDGDQQGTTTTGAHTTAYAYDLLGRKSVCTYPDTTTETWSYDASGNVSQYKNRAGNKCTYSYTDGRNRCTGYSWDDNATQGASYVYDAAGHLIEAANATADILLGYDDSGALVSERSKPSTQSSYLTTSYTHDVDGNVDKITYPAGDVVTYAYDAQERCTGMSAGSTTYSRYNYSGDWLVSRWLLNGLCTGYGHQNNGRIEELAHYRGSSDGTPAANGSVARRFYGYAPDGQVSWTMRWGDGGQNGTNSLQNGRGDAFYYYPDGSLGRAERNVTFNDGWPQLGSTTADSWANLSQVNYSGGTADTYENLYQFDQAGNRTSVTSMNQKLGYADSGSHQGENQYGLPYDANGNTLNAAVQWTYSYDAENKLIEGHGPNGGYIGFAYDALGRLTAQVNLGVYTIFYYAGSQRIEERTSNNTSYRRYFFDAPGGDTLLFSYDPNYGYLWYQYDALGNVSHLTNMAGTVVEQYLYDAFGQPSVYDAAGNARPGGTAVDNRYLFKGAGAYQWLAQAGLYYARARFYLPYHGRWLQPDPIGQAGGLNIYAYCHNDPVNSLDPSGLADFTYAPEFVPVFDTETGEYYNEIALVLVVTPGVVPSGGNGNSGAKSGGSGAKGGASPVPPPPPHFVNIPTQFQGYVSPSGGGQIGGQFSTSDIAHDWDGDPHAYAPEGSGLTGDDYLGNAKTGPKHTGPISRSVIKFQHGQPMLNTDHYYFVLTWFHLFSGEKQGDYPDARYNPLIALGNKQTFGAKVGRGLFLIHNLRNDRYVVAQYYDSRVNNNDGTELTPGTLDALLIPYTKGSVRSTQVTVTFLGNATIDPFLKKH